jgi:hypothetical protein
MGHAENEPPALWTVAAYGAAVVAVVGVATLFFLLGNWIFPP